MNLGAAVNNPFYDNSPSISPDGILLIGPMPWGDCIVDVEDLKILAEHLFEEVPPVE